MRLLSISFNYKKNTNLGYIHSIGETYEEAIMEGKKAIALKKGYGEEPQLDLDLITIRSCTELSNNIMDSTTLLVLPKNK